MALAGLLAAFMAGMAANVSSFNTVFTYDLWQDWLRPGRDDAHYLKVGRAVTVVGTALAIGTAFIAAGFTQHHGLHPDAVLLLQRPAVRGVHPRPVLEADDRARAGSGALVSGTLSAVFVFVLNQTGVIALSGPGLQLPRRRRRHRRRRARRLAGLPKGGTPKPEEDLKGLVWSLTPASVRAVPREAGWYAPRWSCPCWC